PKEASARGGRRIVRLTAALRSIIIHAPRRRRGGDALKKYVLTFALGIALATTASMASHHVAADGGLAVPGAGVVGKIKDASGAEIGDLDPFPFHALDACCVPTGFHPVDIIRKVGSFFVHFTVFADG